MSRVIDLVVLRTLCCVLGYTIVACGGGQSATSTPTIAPAPPAPATASAPVPAAAPVPAPPATEGSQTAAACRGPSLDLAALERARTCDVRDDARPLPADVAPSIEPALVTVRSGGTAPAAIVLTNHGAAAAQLVLDDSCGWMPRVTSELLDAHGARVDVDPHLADDCGVENGCESLSIAIELPPNGTARIPFVVDARKTSVECKDQRRGAVAPGTYDLKANTSFGELHAKARVQ